MTAVTPISDWTDGKIPLSIRRPWRVYEEDLQAKLMDGDFEDEISHKEQLATIQADGAEKAFANLPKDQQNVYAEVSLHELAAYLSFCNSNGTSDATVAWERLDDDGMAEWLVEDARAFLSADPIWAPILGRKETVPKDLPHDDDDQKDDDGKGAPVRRVMHKTALPEGSATASFYTDQVKNFDSRDEALRDLGGNIRCVGHCCRVRKVAGNLTFLKCRLHTSDPPCTWVGLLCTEKDGEANLWRNPNIGHEHCAESKTLTGRGVKSLEERRHIEKELGNASHVLPKTVFRSRRLKSEAAAEIELRHVQDIKKVMMRSRFTARKLGELESKVSKHRTIPADKHRGYFVVHFVGRDSAGKPKLTLLATTRALLTRFAEGQDLVPQADGGFKYNLLGWPLTAIVCSNKAGESFTAALGITSSMVPEHVAELFHGFRHAAERESRKSCNRSYSMSDAEGAYRNGLVSAFGTKPLMCYFHVVSACKQYIESHGIGTAAEKKELWQRIYDDLCIMHNAQNQLDFSTRSKAVLEAWRVDGVPGRTSWQDKKGKPRDFVSYFNEQWLEERPEWAWGVLRRANPDDKQ